jgi:SAM-dependent methyltransferase
MIKAPLYPHPAWLAGILLSWTPLTAQVTPEGGGPDPDAPPFVGTPMPLVERMLDIAGVTEDDVVYDLGSGDGRLVIAAAERGARGVGIEYMDWLVERSWLKADSAGVRSRVDFRHADIFEADFKDATVVTLYLGHAFNMRLRPTLLEQLEPGTRVVSHAFHMSDWEPDLEEVVGSGAARANLYLWVVPARVDGFWFLQIEGMPALTLEVDQSFQRLSGDAFRGNERFALPSGRLEGYAIEFHLREQQGGGSTLEFRGTLEAGRLGGTVSGPAGWGERAWTAMRFSDPALAPPP